MKLVTYLCLLPVFLSAAPVLADADCWGFDCDSDFLVNKISPAVFPTPEVNCILEKVEPIPGDTNSVTTILPILAGSSTTSDGLDYGQYNFSYDVGYYEAAREGEGILVIFYENNSVQDQVGEALCLFPAAASDTFCQHPINDFEGKHAFNFSCAFVD